MNAVRFAGVDHAVGLFEGDAHRLLAEDSLHPGLDGRHDDLGYDGGWQDGRGYVNALIGEHLAVVGIPAFQPKPSPEQFEHLGVLLRHSDNLGAWVELVRARMLRALQPRPDDSDAIWECHVGFLKDSRSGVTTRGHSAIISLQRTVYQNGRPESFGALVGGSTPSTGLQVPAYDEEDSP